MEKLTPLIIFGVVMFSIAYSCYMIRRSIQNDAAEEKESPNHYDGNGY